VKLRLSTNCGKEGKSAWELTFACLFGVVSTAFCE